MEKTSNLVVSILVSVLLSLVIGSFFFGGSGPTFSGFSRTSSVNVIPEESTDGFSVGTTTNAALIKYIGGGTCTLTADTSITATSTGTGTCATTGSQVGDIIVFNVSTTTTKQSANIIPIGTIAGSNSSTIRLFNLTGGNIVPSAVNGFGSSSPYQIFRVTSISSEAFNR